MQTATGQSSIKMTTMTSTKRQPAADGTATSTMISWEEFLIWSLCRSLLVKTVAMTARFQFCWWIRTGPLHAEESTCINLLFDVKCVILIPTDLNLHWQDMHAIAVAAAGPFLKHLILFQGTCEGKCESYMSPVSDFFWGYHVSGFQAVINKNIKSFFQRSGLHCWWAQPRRFSWPETSEDSRIRALCGAFVADSLDWGVFGEYGLPSFKDNNFRSIHENSCDFLGGSILMFLVASIILFETSSWYRGREGIGKTSGLGQRRRQAGSHDFLSTDCITIILYFAILLFIFLQSKGNGWLPCKLKTLP